MTVAAVLALGGVLAASVPDRAAPPASSPQGTEVRVATYNVRSGFGVDGRFDPDGLARILEGTGADVVVINEVDRGWLLEGGHDLLQLLATRTGMSATFAPAADPLWGNAVLSRIPVVEAAVVPLPAGGAPVQRSLVSVVVEVGPQLQLGVVGTQLHPVGDEPAVRLAQARTVTAEVARLRARGLAVAVLGDLGADLDAPELAPLELVHSAVPGARPTWPAHAPELRRDHVLVTPDLAATEPVVVPVVATDHLPVAVTLTVPAGGAD